MIIKVQIILVYNKNIQNTFVISHAEKYSCIVAKWSSLLKLRGWGLRTLLVLSAAKRIAWGQLACCCETKLRINYISILKINIFTSKYHIEKPLDKIIKNVYELDIWKNLNLIMYWTLSDFSFQEQPTDLLG